MEVPLNHRFETGCSIIIINHPFWVPRISGSLHTVILGLITFNDWTQVDSRRPRSP